MKPEEYKARIDAELEKMDWRDRDIKHSSAYRVLSDAALDRENGRVAEAERLLLQVREGAVA